MYNIVFYEDSNGNCDLRDFLHMMQQKKKRAFYKLVAFLDYLAEKGADDKAVCRSPGYTIYMHGIPGVCVILYAQCRKDSDGEEIYVLLHHYFTDRTSGGVPLIQLYNAIRKLRRYRQMRYPVPRMGSTGRCAKASPVPRRGQEGKESGKGGSTGRCAKLSICT